VFYAKIAAPTAFFIYFFASTASILILGSSISIRFSAKTIKNPLAMVSKRKNRKKIVLLVFPYWDLSKRKILSSLIIPPHCMGS